MMAVPASAQLPESALDHMLQRPLTNKRFENKRIGDHLFLEGSMGTRFEITNRPRMGLNGTVAVGDWITPEHGARIGIGGGQFPSTDELMTNLAISADYLLNFTAVASEGNYDEPKKFEVYGVAGLDFYGSNLEGKREYGYGVHLGLRGQLNLTPLTYFYVEPQVGVVQDDFMHTHSFRGYRYASNVQLGFGYRLLQSPNRSTETFEKGSFLDNTYVSLFGGATAFLFDYYGDFVKSRGARVGIGLGKNFDAYNGLRFSAYAGGSKQYRGGTLALVGLNLDYLLNLHSLFGGEKSDRPFWINAVAGGGVHTTSWFGHRTSWSLGAGMQANVRLNDRWALFIEPRVDMYDGDYAPAVMSTKNKDITGAIMAGFTMFNGADALKRDGISEKLERKHWYSNTFVEIGGGVNTIGSAYVLAKPTKYINGVGDFAIGKWYTPKSGIRLWGSFGRLKAPDYGTWYNFVGIGADYLWNVTNAIKGYDPDRDREFIVGLGVTGGRTENTDNKFVFGLKGSVRRQWNLNKMLGIYVEPQVRAYKKDFLPGVEASVLDMDINGSVMVGLQLRMK